MSIGKSGPEIFLDLLGVINAHVDDEATKSLIFEDMVGVFEDHDCNNLYELYNEDPLLDTILKELYPLRIEDEDVAWDNDLDD